MSDKKQALERTVQLAIELAKQQGATSSVVTASFGSGLTTTVRLGELETVEHHLDQSLSVTVYKGQSKGIASGTAFDEASVNELVSAACNIASFTEEDPFAGLPDKMELATEWPELDLYYPWNISVDEAVELCQRCEALTLKVDKRIKNSDGANLSTYAGLRTFGNSLGFLNTFASSKHSLDVCVIADENGQMQRDASYSEARAAEDLWSPKRIATEAAERTLRRLNPQKIKTGKFPVLFAADVAQGLFGHYLGAISGGNLYRHSSFLLDSLGKQVFPKWFTMHEDPYVKRGLASCPYDAEAVKVSARDLVLDGHVNGYLLSTYSARKLGLKSTGNSGGSHNVTVSHTNQSLDALLKMLGTGLLVTDVIGQGVNMVTGDYSRGANGLWVENGEIKHAVEEVTIAGNLNDMFGNIVAIGNDTETRGSLQTGSILIETMMVASG